MSNGDYNLQDDAALDELLAGRDDLSRQLAALAQPEASRQVNDAIMASIEAQLAQERAAQTVQQALAGEDAPAAQNPAAAEAVRVTQVAPRQPAANKARWRAPAALAASLVGALLLALEWQRGDYAEQAQMTTAAPEQKPVASTPQAAEPPARPPAAPERVTMAAASASGHIASSPGAARPAPAPSASRAESVDRSAPSLLADADKAPEPIAITPPAEQFLRARSSPIAKLAAAVPPPVASAPISAPLVAPLSYAAPPAPPAPPPTPAPAPVVAAATAPTIVSVTGSARKAMSPADTARAAEWLHVIDEMLKADLRQDAREEWRKFNLAYPDYPVPEQLARRMDAIN
ncbi:hypothetical protein GTP55_15930 [Duganella sp. FT109W]|uniref:Uncharacterized protein n=1 Tax=Duganella margarita TaxID=2692170 RepID=A0ABW9WIJ4_9BURK|nr:hypothetical protein [Duganella margarita]MYN40856.1 hypothetical protein [Duganella margarita]